MKRHLIVTGLLGSLAVFGGCTKKSPEQKKAEVKAEANKDVAEERKEEAKDVAEANKDAAEARREADKDVTEIAKDAQEDINDINKDAAEDRKDNGGIGATGSRDAGDSKDAFKDIYKKKLDTLDERLDKVEDVVKKGDKNAPANAANELTNGRAKYEAAKKALDDVDQGKDESWTARRPAIENAFTEAESAVKRAEDAAGAH